MTADLPVPSDAQRWAERFAGLPEVQAVALGGSLAMGTADDASDIDLEVYAAPLPPIDVRRRMIEPEASYAEVGNDFFGAGDEWTEHGGRAFDVAYFDPAWMEDQLDRVLVRHEASVGWTTCFWHTVLRCRVLFDRSGRLTALQERARQPYPELLRLAIVAKNHTVLRTKTHSLVAQIELSLRRDDPVGVQHRVAAVLASCFDLVFALNRVPNPGEKRLLQHARTLCPLLPPDFEAQVRAVVASPPETSLLPRIGALLDGLDALLLREGLLPSA